MVNAQPSGLYRTYFRLTDIAHDLYRVRGTPYHYLQITTLYLYDRYSFYHVQGNLDAADIDYRRMTQILIERESNL